jgi:hypothetical protein
LVSLLQQQITRLIARIVPQPDCLLKLELWRLTPKRSSAAIGTKAVTKLTEAKSEVEATETESKQGKHINNKCK